MEQTWTSDQTDILGEVANISMGNSATTLSLMVNRRVRITTPNVKIISRSASLDDYEKTCVFVQIHYIKGLSGNNVLILKDRDVKCMTDLMMGGDGTHIEAEISELQLSATSMSTMLNIPIDISTPVVNQIDVESVKLFEKIFESTEEKFVKVSFRMEIGDLIDSTMVQLYPVHFAAEMCEKFKEGKLQGRVPVKKTEE